MPHPGVENADSEDVMPNVALTHRDYESILREQPTTPMAKAILKQLKAQLVPAYEGQSGHAHPSAYTHEAGEDAGPSLGWEVLQATPAAPTQAAETETDPPLGNDHPADEPGQTMNLDTGQVYANTRAQDTHPEGVQWAWATSKLRKNQNVYVVHEIKPTARVNSAMGGVTTSWKKAMAHPEAERFVAAREVEMANLQNHGTFTQVPTSEVPKGTKIAPSGMGFTLKMDTDGVSTAKAKARWHINGARVAEDGRPTSSPTPKASTMRTCIANAAMAKNELKSGDVSAACLRSELNPNTPTIYFKAPYDQPELNKMPDGRPAAYKLERNLYGLRDAGLNFYKTVRGWLIGKGWKVNPRDACHWTRTFATTDKSNGQMELVIYVDDLLWHTKSTQAHIAFVSECTARWGSVKPQKANLFLGMSIEHHQDGDISVTMSAYLANVKQTFGDMMPSHHKQTPLPPGYTSDQNECAKPGHELNPETYPFRRLSGTLMYCGLTRYDAMHALSNHARVQSRCSLKQFEMLQPTAACLVGTAKQGMRYTSKPKELKTSDTESTTIAPGELVVMTDSSHAELATLCACAACAQQSGMTWTENQSRMSYIGFVAVYAGSLIDFYARVCKRTHSSTESELQAASEGTKRTIALRETMAFTNPKVVKQPTPLYVDNQSCIKMCVHTAFNTHTKRNQHVDAKWFIARDNEGIAVNTKWTHTHCNVADQATKALTAEAAARLSQVWQHHSKEQGQPSTPGKDMSTYYMMPGAEHE